MLAERIVEWTEQWKREGLQAGMQQGLQQGLEAERKLLLRQVRRRFGEAVAAQSGPLLARIEQTSAFEDLGEALLDCVDGAAWLARLGAGMDS